MNLKQAFLLLTATCLFFSVQIVKAQVSCFTIDHPKGCAPFVVNVTDCSSGAISINYDFGAGLGLNGAGLPGSVTPSAPYTTPGTYNIRQKLTGGSEPETSQSINVITAVKPTFTVKLCEGKQVSVTITDNTYDKYEIDFGDGLPRTPNLLPNSTTTKAYLTSGQKDIIVYGKFTSGNDCGVASTSVTQSIFPIDQLPQPDISFLEVTKEGLTDGEIEVHLTVDPNAEYYRYELLTNTTYPNPVAGYVYMGGNPAVPENSIFSINAGIVTLKNINTLNEFHCLKVKPVNVCTHNPSSNYNEICSIRSFDVQAQNLQNDLTWTNYPGPDVSSTPPSPTIGSTNFSRTEIERNGTMIDASASSPRPDNAVVCATNYCYQVKTILKTISSSTSTNAYSLSAKKCVTAISTAVPTAVTNVNSTINGTNTQVAFDAPVGFTVKKYYVFDSNGNTANSGTSNNVSFAGNPGTCYRVAYDDNCNNRSIVSPFTCTVNLTANLANDGSIALNWSAYSGYLSTGIASYDVLFLNENNQIVKTIPAGLGLSASDIPDENAGRLFYKIRVNSGGPENLVSYSNLVEISLEPTVFIPNAFTPNGDGTNDTFIAKSRFVKNLEMTIYNRWGEPVFKTTDIKTGWDGKVNGTDAPVGSYAYVIKVEGNKGESSTERGSISLIR